VESRTAFILLAALWSGVLSGASAKAANVCELSGGVVKGELCFLPCDNPGEVRVQQPNGELTCVPPGQPAAAPSAPAVAPPAPAAAPPAPAAAPPAPAAAPPVAPVKPGQPAAPAKQASDECTGKGGVRLGEACFLPCPKPNETRVQLADGTLKCVVIVSAPPKADGKPKKPPPVKKKP
jgi:hypothetical protein